ncbi:MAG: hypothetical protein MUD12_16755 [Spirochaetes bacterium]|jgi:hypothetical protein|nr:hypothetical protein [Spirochaetota bacterium]
MKNRIAGVILGCMGVFLIYFYATHQKVDYYHAAAKPTCLLVGIPSLLAGFYFLRLKEEEKGEAPRSEFENKIPDEETGKIIRSLSGNQMEEAYRILTAIRASGNPNDHDLEKQSPGRAPGTSREVQDTAGPDPVEHADFKTADGKITYSQPSSDYFSLSKLKNAMAVSANSSKY